MSDLNGLLGFTEYEGRVYRALLAESPATAYRLGKSSGVPLSRVYEAANRLVEKGAATVEPGDPARYRPVPPATLIADAKGRTATQLESLDRELTALFRADSAARESWVQGEAGVLSRISAITAESKRQVLIAAPPSTQARIRGAVKSDAEVLLDFLALPERSASFTILIDGATAMIGALGESARAMVTEEPAFTALLTDYFRLKLAGDSARDATRPSPPIDLHADWLDWEKEKQDRLLGIRIPVIRQP